MKLLKKVPAVVSSGAEFFLIEQEALLAEFVVTFHCEDEYELSQQCHFNSKNLHEESLRSKASQVAIKVGAVAPVSLSR